METVNVTAVDLFIQDALLEIRGAPTAANLTEFIDQLFAGPDRDFLRSTSLPGETWGEVDGQCFLLLDEASKGDAKLEALVERAIGTSEAAVDQISLRDLRLRPATMLGIAVLLLLTIKGADVDVEGFKVHVVNEPIVGEVVKDVIDRLISNVEVQKIARSIQNLGQQSGNPASH